MPITAARKASDISIWADPENHGDARSGYRDYVRRRLVRRPLAIFGAVPNNAPVLSKGKAQDINWRGQMDRRGVHIHHVGTVGIKHLLYSRISADTDKDPAARLVHLSDELPPEYFGGLVSETYNPQKNRFEKRRNAPRNEPLDTWVYAYAATHHPELRLHRRSKADWDAAEARLRSGATQSAPPAPDQPSQKPVAQSGKPKPFNGFGTRRSLL